MLIDLDVNNVHASQPTEKMGAKNDLEMAVKLFKDQKDNFTI